MITLPENIYLFNSLTDDEINKVSNLVIETDYRKSDVILKKGDYVSEIYIIKSGSVKVQLPQEKTLLKEDDLVTILKKGECFGELSFIDSGSASATIIANQDSIIYSIQKEDFKNFLLENHDIERKIYNNLLITLVKRVRNTTQNLVGSRFFISSFLTS
ncbi:MAG: cyclic nucleotide-binding domain-containing protein [Pseudomonadota bacterium]